MLTVLCVRQGKEKETVFVVCCIRQLQKIVAQNVLRYLLIRDAPLSIVIPLLLCDAHRQ